MKRKGVINPFAEKEGYETLRRHGNALLTDFLNPAAFGAHSAMCFGPIGSGKTSLLLALAELFRKNGWYVVIRGREILEVPRLPNWKEKTEIFIPKGYRLRIKVQGQGTKKYPTIETKEYKSVVEVAKLLHRNKLTVVYADPNVEVPEWLKAYEQTDVIPREAIFGMNSSGKR